MKKFLTLLFFFTFITVCIAEQEPIHKVIKCNDSTNICIVRDKMLYYGLADKDNNIIIPMEYTNIKVIPNEENYLLEKKSKTGEFLYGIANQKGDITIKPEYHSITKTDIPGKYKFQPDWNLKYGLIDGSTGDINIQPVYNYFHRLGNDDFCIEKDLKEGIIDSNFNLIIPAEYYRIYVMNGYKYYTLHKEIHFINNEGIPDSKFVYGIADRTGKIIVPLECSWIEHGIASTFYKVIKGGKTYEFDANTGVLELKG